MQRVLQSGGGGEKSGAWLSVCGGSNEDGAGTKRKCVCIYVCIWL